MGKQTDCELIKRIKAKTKATSLKKRRATLKLKGASLKLASKKKNTTTTPRIENSVSMTLDSFDMREQQSKLAQMFFDVSSICRKLLDDGLKDHTSLSASKLNVIFRLLTQANASLDSMATIVQEEKEEAQYAENDGMTEEEAELLKKFEEMERASLTEPMNIREG